MKDDPIVKEVRAAGRKLLERSGGTYDSLVAMIRREEAKETRPMIRRPFHLHPHKARSC